MATKKGPQMKALAVGFLLLLAFFTGGGSLLATPLMFSAGINAGAMLVWLSGFLIAGLCIYALTKTMPSIDPPQISRLIQPKDTSDTDDIQQ